MTAVPDESKVVYNFLGKSGLKVANICLGTMTFGDSGRGVPGQASEENAHQMLDRYVEWGGNFIDTADVYSNGLSEKIIGTWLKKQEREKFVLATKVRQGSLLPPNKVGLSRRHIVKSIEDSLERLQTNYVDLYQMHVWDDATPLEETLRTFDDLIRCGKIHYVGASNVVGWQMQKLVCTTEKLGLNPIVSLQQQYNLLVREVEFEPLQVCKGEGIAVLPWSPLKGGMLTGKYTRESPPSSGRMGWVREDEKARGNQAMPAWTSMEQNPQVWDVIDALQDIAKTHGKSMAQVSIRWLLQKDVVPSVVIGATKMSQMEDNLGAASGWKLSAEEMARLDQISQPRVPYPYELIWRINKQRCNPFHPPLLVSSTS